METDPIRQSDRFAKFCADVLDPAVFTDPHPLAVEAFQSPDPIPCPQAARAPFAPVPLGWSWGPVWSTTWFRLRTPAAPAPTSGALALRFDTGVEAQLWCDGIPIQGFDVNRDAALIPAPIPSQPGQPLELLVEAACNHPFGVSHFPWDPPDAVRRWTSDTPARLTRAELATFHEPAWRLATAYRFALLLLRELPAESPRAQQLISALSQATRAIDDHRVAETAPAALEIVLATLRSPAPGSATICHATGHAHIDTAWLWPIRETRRKCIRSFSNVLRLMERFPDFRFLCSQAQQYAFIEQDAPALFDQIASRVRDGRWEPGGAMWIEPDANCPSGESLVRQILHGTRYWREKFGDAGAQRFVYLPDTFGFPPCLPQIIAHAGLDTFITNKLAWNAVNHYPHTSFLWRGIDGTEILTHFTPGADYNAVNTPLELRRGEKRHASKHQPGAETAARWLQPFGYGDGGGGPTDRSIHYAELAAECDGLPRTHLSRTDDFCEALHRDFDALRARNERPPVWDGELYLDLHRGTFTTQAWLKSANRRAEELLRLAELLATSTPNEAPRPATAESRASLDRAWKLLLLNQFHDILPGSSIQWVYDDAKRDHARIREIVQPLVAEGLDRWSTALGGPVVLNPCSTPRSGVVESGARLHWAADVPALGARAIDSALTPAQPVRITNARTLANGLISATINDDGTLASLRCLANDREALTGQPANQLALYEDRPRMWDAWDIDPEAETKPIDQIGAALIHRDRPRARPPLRHPSHPEPRSAQLDRADLHPRRGQPPPRHPLAGALARRPPRPPRPFPRGRPIHPRHLRDPVRPHRAPHPPQHAMGPRQVRGLRPPLGRPLRARPRRRPPQRLQVRPLLRRQHPRPHAPPRPRLARPRRRPGRARITYALMPHAGDWRAAGVDREAEALNTPPFAHEPSTPRAPSSTAPDAWAPFEIDCPSPAHLATAAFKHAEDGDGLILRLVETHGARAHATIRWHTDVHTVQATDLLERPISNPAKAPTIEHGRAARRTTLEVRPFQLITLRLR
ncbi:MAG: alpha-mannosidase [Phycisphaerales bacterium]|nr:alpha-mannosidase [Phycisphaerales bacterium]